MLINPTIVQRPQARGRQHNRHQAQMGRERHDHSYSTELIRFTFDLYVLMTFWLHNSLEVINYYLIDF